MTWLIDLLDWLPVWVSVGLLIVFAIALIAGIYLLQDVFYRWQIKSRHRKRIPFARKHGFGERLDNDDGSGRPFLPEISHFGSFPGQWELTGIMDRKEGGETTYIYDLNSHMDAGEGGTQMKTRTICQMVSDDLALPEFHLMPEGFFAKVKDMFTHADIDFEDFPEFSNQYTLIAGEEGDQEKVRELFRPEVLAYLEKHLNYTAWGKGDTLLLYRHNKVLTRETRLNTLLDDARRLAGLLQRGD